MNQEFIVVLFNITFAFGIWWLYFVEYKSYRIDLVRQRLFRIRDELFYYTESHEQLDFNSKAYTQMRTTANGMIRFAHKVSLISLIATIIADRVYNGGKSAEQFESAIEDALDDLPKDSRGEIYKMRNRMHFILAKHITVMSTFLLVLFCIAWTLRLSRKIGKALISGGHHNQTKQRWSSIDAAAEEMGACYPPNAMA